MREKASELSIAQTTDSRERAAAEEDPSEICCSWTPAEIERAIYSDAAGRLPEGSKVPKTKQLGKRTAT